MPDICLELVSDLISRCSGKLRKYNSAPRLLMVHRELLSNLRRDQSDECILQSFNLRCNKFLVVLRLKRAAQEKTPRYEFGIHYAALNVTEKSDKDSGLGFRFTYNFNDYLGVEAEETYFPNLREGSEGNERQGLFGVRAGKRTKRYGVFAKVRPGFTRFYSLDRPGLPLFEQDRTRFTVDVGGVFEYYLHRHLAVRVDAGDTMVHFKTGDFFQQDFNRVFVQKKLSHNLQINVGVALRF